MMEKFHFSFLTMMLFTHYSIVPIALVSSRNFCKISFVWSYSLSEAKSRWQIDPVLNGNLDFVGIRA
jgi:hypothetical protein